ncbi:hypothetical protein [Polaribacter filamentus]|uniref:hypothetical protein n=1 Tax=Polaribacter filamentus TaxID=53483 RepID=UPI0014752D23|nr:hypothetical protein [Polaribacter filamentus]
MISKLATSSTNSGTIAPNSNMTLTVTVDRDLAIGDYSTILSLDTDYDYNEKYN